MKHISHKYLHKILGDDEVITNISNLIKKSLFSKNIKETIKNKVKSGKMRMRTTSMRSNKNQI